MILGFTWLDAVLVLVLVLLVVQGHRRGLWVVLGNLVGFALGAVIAFYALPVVAQWSAGSPWRWAALAATVVLLLASGQYVGAATGEAVRLRVGAPALRRIDHLLGAAATVVVASLMMGFVAFSADSLGSAPVTREVARSRVLAAIDALIPDPLMSWAARSRTAVVELDVIPELRLPEPSPAPPSPRGGVQAGAPTATPTAPAPGEVTPPPPSPTRGEATTSAAPAETEAPAWSPSPSPEAGEGSSASAPTTPAWSPSPPRSPEAGSSAPEAGASEATAPEAAAPTTSAPPKTKPAPAPAAAPVADAADAVVRVTGTAESCSQVQSGSGVAVAPDRVLTNAHVVAGVSAPTVVDRERGVYVARVLLLDTARDLAILAVDGADLPVARLGAELGVGEAAEVMGFPDGGPFARIPATVDAKGEVPLQDVSSTAVSSVDVYTLAAAVRHGFSGGPVVGGDGSLVGLVFARAPGDAGTGYALTADTIASAVRRASALSATTSAGQCTPGG